MTVFTGVLPLLEKAINRYLQLDPESPERLAALSGRVMAVEMRGWGVTFYMRVTPEQITLRDHLQGTPDVTLTGAPFSLARMGLSTAPTKSFFGQGVTVSGDVEISQQFKDLFDDLEIDWEEYLSYATGDVIAHQMGNMARWFSDKRKKITRTLQQDLTEILQEELQYFPPREEINDFMSEIDHLRNDAERLQQRVHKLGKDNT